MNMSSEVEPGISAGYFHRLVWRSLEVVKEVKKFPEDKKLYVRVILRSGETFYASAAYNWVDNRTGEKIIIFISDDKSIVVSFSNVDRIEFLYERPDEKAPGFKIEKEQEPKAIQIS